MTPRVSRTLASEEGRPESSFIQSWLEAWDFFWFTPTSAETLALIRICCGAMIVYIHCIWISMLPNFMGSGAWIDNTTIRELHRQDWAWSWLFYVESPTLLYLHQVVAILASVCMTVGLATRLAIPVTWWMTLMVCQRMTGALFGLDQVVMMLSMYLMWSRCGSIWSLDARIRRKSSESKANSPDGMSCRSEVHSSSQASYIESLITFLWPFESTSVSNNIATRLIQLHLCVIYVFGGLSKMRGEMWWDGSAIWFSIVNYEYQSLNLTWLGHFPLVIGTMTAVTIFWETFYCALVWPRLTRPLTLAIAFLVHGGICIALGMWTFGTMMLVANLSFVSPQRIKRLFHRFT